VVLVDVWSNASAQQLELQISLKDTTYLMCEPIWLDAEITNISKDTVRIWGLHFPGGGHLNVILTDEQGDTLRLRYLDNYRDLSGFILNPGETHFEALALAEIFWNYDVPSVSRHSLRFTSLAPGSYQVNAQYRRRYDSDRIDTSPLHFRVVEPTGAEREALDLLLEIYKNWMSSNHEKVSQLLNNLTANYPKSAYLERAYLRVGKKEELLEKLPDTGYLNGYLNTVVEKISDEKEKREFLENIIRKHPGTRTARYAEQELRRLQRGE
jgi:hypothetical protein